MSSTTGVYSQTHTHKRKKKKKRKQGTTVVTHEAIRKYIHINTSTVLTYFYLALLHPVNKLCPSTQQR
jgi:hypothetical protein